MLNIFKYLKVSNLYLLVLLYHASALEEPCRDMYGFCETYATEGHCSLNAGWMTLNCPVSCDSCHLRDPAVRCTHEFLNISSVPTYLPGEIDGMFSELQGKYGSLYSIKVVSNDPWIVVFDDFLDNEEIHALVSTQNSWQRSTENAHTNSAGSTARVERASRTSSTSWCWSECASHPAVRRVLERIVTVTGVPITNHEDIQVLKCGLNKYIK